MSTQNNAQACLFHSFQFMNLLSTEIVALLFLCSTVRAGDLVVERSCVDDPDGRMMLEQVQKAPQSPFAGQYFCHGFSASTFWIPLRIDHMNLPEGNPSDRLIVSIRPIYLDEIELHDPMRGQVRPAVTGNRNSWLNDPYRLFNLMITQGSVLREIRLRLQSTTSIAV